MSPTSAGERLKMLAEACSHIENAMDLLDAADAPGNIAAHLDLALNQLEDALSEVGSAEARRSDTDEDCGAEPVR